MKLIKIFTAQDITPYQLAQFERCGCDGHFEKIKGQNMIIITRDNKNEKNK